jgi:hypothetical protein
MEGANDLTKKIDMANPRGEGFVKKKKKAKLIKCSKGEKLGTPKGKNLHLITNVFSRIPTLVGLGWTGPNFF